MNILTLEKLCADAIEVVRHAGQFIKRELDQVQVTDIHVKARNSLVSYVDKEAERMLVKGLSEILPAAAFLTEEQTVEQSSGDLQWIIDPLDGTTNFLHGIPMFSVSVALAHKGELVIGIVYEPCRDEIFYAFKNGGARLNGSPIRVSQQTEIADALVITGFPYTLDEEVLSGILAAIEAFTRHTRGLRRFGSAAIDLAYVACGRAEAFYEPLLAPWDVAGGSLIVKEAGGIVTDFQGGEHYLHGGSILASNGQLHPAVLAMVQQAFKSNPV